jgi:hypothetical protein
MSEVRIVMQSHGRGQVFVNGVELEDVAAVEFCTGVKGVNRVTVTLIPEEVEITGIADVTQVHAVLTKPAVNGHGD